MNPTMKLRFVEREITMHHADCLYASVTTVRVLQQWFEWSQDVLTNDLGEWRDVPLEKEDKK